MNKHIIQEPKVISQIIGKLLTGDEKIQVNIITIGTIDVHGRSPYIEITDPPDEVQELLTDDAIQKARQLNQGQGLLNDEMTLQRAMEKVSALPDRAIYKTSNGRLLTRSVVEKAIKDANWNQREAARRLRVNYSTFRYYQKKHKIAKEGSHEENHPDSNERADVGVAGN